MVSTPQRLLISIVIVICVNKTCEYFVIDKTSTMVAQVAITMILVPRIVEMLSPQKVGGAAASLSSLKYVQGEAFELGGGKVSVIEFWATWCPPCKIAIPHLNKLYVENYKAKGVQLVGVTKEDEVTVKPFIAERKHQFTYPVAIDSSGAVSAGYPCNGIPAAFIVDHEGNVQWKGHPMDGSFVTALDTCVENAKLGHSPKTATLKGGAKEAKVD